MAGGGAVKYRNVKTVCPAGHKHDSKKEAARCAELHLLLKGGEISDLRQQPTFQIEVNGHRVCRYKADFAYKQGGEQVVEDCKGFRTATYRLKAKLLRATHGIEVLET
jgi:hypothetical protein